MNDFTANFLTMENVGNPIPFSNIFLPTKPTKLIKYTLKEKESFTQMVKHFQMLCSTGMVWVKTTSRHSFLNEWMNEWITLLPTFLQWTNTTQPPNSPLSHLLPAKQTHYFVLANLSFFVIL